MALCVCDKAILTETFLCFLEWAIRSFLPYSKVSYPFVYHLHFSYSWRPCCSDYWLLLWYFRSCPGAINPNLFRFVVITVFVLFITFMNYFQFEIEWLRTFDHYLPSLYSYFRDCLFLFGLHLPNHVNRCQHDASGRECSKYEGFIRECYVWLHNWH